MCDVGDKQSPLQAMATDQAARAAGVSTAEEVCPKCGAELQKVMGINSMPYACGSFSYSDGVSFESGRCVKNQLAQAKETIAELEGKLEYALESIKEYVGCHTCAYGGFKEDFTPVECLLSEAVYPNGNPDCDSYLNLEMAGMRYQCDVTTDAINKFNEATRERDTLARALENLEEATMLHCLLDTDTLICHNNYIRTYCNDDYACNNCVVPLAYAIAEADIESRVTE